MAHLSRRALAGSALTFAALLAGCSVEDSSTPDGGTAGDAADGAGEGTVSLDHAFGRTEIPASVEVVTTVAWANHEVPLALGVVPAGMAAANFGDDDGNGMLPWVEAALDELGATAPVLFDESDGIDIEGVADTAPDVILAAYSGLTQEDYDTPRLPLPLSPEVAWGTSRRMITANAAEWAWRRRAALITDPRARSKRLSAAPRAAAERHVRRTWTPRTSTVNFYTAHDTRTMFFEDPA